MSRFEDYEVLAILGTHLNGTTYKVKEKKTSQVFLLRAINYETYNIEYESVIKHVEQRFQMQQSNYLRIQDYMSYKLNHTIYLLTEYCKYGTLNNVLERCLKEGEYLNENFIWNFLYKLAVYIKSCDNRGHIDQNDIFIDNECNLKFFHFTLNQDNNDKMKETKMCNLIHSIIYLDNDKFPNNYSNELRDLVIYLEEHESNCCNVILCHPKVLSKLNIPINIIFIKDDKISRLSEDQPHKNESEKYQEKLENLRNREALLKIAEEKLREKTLNLDKREKKVALMERIAKEKVARADVYLKRSKEYKAVTQPTSSYEKLDTSYSADCGESVIQTTSRKLNTQNLMKPKFQKVRFKTHSPLKGIHTMKRELKKQTEVQTSDSDKMSEGSEKNKRSLFSTLLRSKKNVVPKSVQTAPSTVSSERSISSESGTSGHTYEEIDCQRINWNHENKRQAFELLRIMNGENNGSFKHTIM